MTETVTTSRPKPRLTNLAELYETNPDRADQHVKKVVDHANSHGNETYYTTLPPSQLKGYPNHPFSLYEGKRKQDMIDDISANGVLNPLIVHEVEIGSYVILSGHNRKECSVEAGLSEVPVLVHRNLSEEEARTIVIHTNAFQRSFNELALSEQAAIIAEHHSRLFSQGKRNDIADEIFMLENPHNDRENATCEQFAHKLPGGKSREELANYYGLEGTRIARLLRLDKTIPEIKELVDSKDIPFAAAVDLSYLKESRKHKEQTALVKCMRLNGFQVDMKKAALLRSFSEKCKLDEDQIYLILNGEVKKGSSKKRSPSVKIRQEIYNKYFTPKQSVSEIQDYVVKALEHYTAYLNQQKEHHNTQEDPRVDNYDDRNEWADGISM